MLSRRELANAIRILSVDAVEQAKSGHPGMPMGMADIAEVLWNNFLKHNPSNPDWINRDRFVVSNGHGCMLLYALLHLTGYSLSIDDIKNFRQLHSKTPGHPEYGITPGVETTTGPLGQGLANAVGMAIAERTLAAQFNRPNHQLIDHYTYVFAGDGCLMEGISHEVCSLAGTLGLGKLILFYDDNGISIDGKVGGWFTDDTPKRFAAYNWHVIENVDGHDPVAVEQAIREAQAVTDKPSILCCKTEIGYGAPNLAGSHKAHSDPLGETEIKAVRENLGWHHAPFVITEKIYAAWDAKITGENLENSWNDQFALYQKEYPLEAAELLRRLNKEFPKNWTNIAESYLQECAKKLETTATRKASLNCLEEFAPSFPELIGGSADLTGSNCTWWSQSESVRKFSGGNYIHYGVREFGMFAIMNGIALHGGFIPYGGTFLTFLDYGRNAIRLSAMMQQQIIYVFTHDSVGLGQDGPTHQPIEHISLLRLTPNLVTWRPCDTVETAAAWQSALEHKTAPTCLLLTRQNVPAIKRNPEALQNIQRGAYILRDCSGEPDIILIATGSEVQLAVSATAELEDANIKIRIISMPSPEIFAKQPLSYQNSLLPEHITNRIAIEAGASNLWFKWVGTKGKVIGIDRFGESAPAEEVFREFGFTVEHVKHTILEAVENKVAK